MALTLVAAFVALSAAVGLGALDGLDRWIAAHLAALWWEPLHPGFQALAMLGGSEASLFVAAGLVVYLRRSGFAREAWVVMALPAAVGLELVYKHLLSHPGPGPGLHHADGPSLSELLAGAEGASSFPSGHVVRTVLVYGLMAFVVYRLAGPGRARTLVLMGVLALGIAMSADRLYLGVHWMSDVLGGLLLGGLALAFAIVWLDRVPRLEA